NEFSILDVDSQFPADVREMRVEHAGDSILEDQRIVGDPHEVIVDVAEAERHPGAGNGQWLTAEWSIDHGVQRVAIAINPQPSAMDSVSVPHLHGERSLGGREARDRDAVRRRAYVVEPHIVEEVDRRGVAAVLAADAELQVLACLAPALDADADDVADAGDVDRRERILLEDLL